jgi:hypothetical protein
MLSGAWRGQRGLQSLSLTTVLDTHRFQGRVSALPFSGEFLTVLTTQSSEFLAVLSADLKQLLARLIGVTSGVSSGLPRR